jgi:hypothetical protein
MTIDTVCAPNAKVETKQGVPAVNGRSVHVREKKIAMYQHLESTMLAVPVSHSDCILGPETAKITLVEYGGFECLTAVRLTLR